MGPHPCRRLLGVVDSLAACLTCGLIAAADVSTVCHELHIKFIVANKLLPVCSC